MSTFFCPSCGKEHKINSQFCSFCGEDLEDFILKFKEQHLPITIDSEKIDKAQPKDKWEESTQKVLKIKEQKKERERIEKLMEPKPEPAVEMVVSNEKTKLLFGFFTMLFLSFILVIFRFFHYDISRILYRILIAIPILLFAISWILLINKKNIVRYKGKIVFQQYAEKEREKGITGLCYWMFDFTTPAERKYRRDVWKNMPNTDKLLILMFALLDIAIMILFFLVI